MREVHEPVPQFNAKLLMSVERFVLGSSVTESLASLKFLNRTLKRMIPAAPFERSSWGIADDDQLFWHNMASLGKGEKTTVSPENLSLRIDRRGYFSIHSPGSNVV